LLKILAARFPPGAPPDLARGIGEATDEAQLTAWIDAALSAGSLDDFRRAAQPGAS
jgi:hypothetical protein